MQHKTFFSTQQSLLLEVRILPKVEDVVYLEGRLKSNEYGNYKTTEYVRRRKQAFACNLTGYLPKRNRNFNLAFTVNEALQWVNLK